MSTAIGLRGDFDATRLRAIAKQANDGPQARRLLPLASIYEGATRTEAAKIGGVTLQIVRDWVLKFNAHGPEGSLNRKAPGQPSRLKDEHRTALTRMIENGPIPAIHGVVRWRLVDLCQWVFVEFRIHVAPDDEPGAERHGLPQTFRQATPLCPSRYRRSTLVQTSHGMLSNLWGLP